MKMKYSLIYWGCIVFLFCNCIKQTSIKVPIPEYSFKDIKYGSTPTEVITAFGKPASIDSSYPGGYLCEMNHYKDITIGITNNHVFEIKTSSIVYEPLGIKTGLTKSQVARIMKKYKNISDSKNAVWQYVTTEDGVYAVLRFNERNELVEQGFTIDLP